MKGFRGVPIRLVNALLQQERGIRARWSMPAMPIWMLQVLSLLCWMGIGACVGLMILVMR